MSEVSEFSSDTKPQPQTAKPSDKLGLLTASHREPNSGGFYKLGLEDLENSETSDMHATLDMMGFKKVRSLKSEAGLKSFIRRTAAACDMKIIDEGGLNGAATYFANDHKTTFEDVKETLFSALLAGSRHHWATVKTKSGVTGSSAPLDLFGFVQV